jgi:hypothetical protein
VRSADVSLYRTLYRNLIDRDLSGKKYQKYGKRKRNYNRKKRAGEQALNLWVQPGSSGL